MNHSYGRNDNYKRLILVVKENVHLKGCKSFMSDNEAKTGIMEYNGAKESQDIR